MRGTRLLPKRNLIPPSSTPFLNNSHPQNSPASLRLSDETLGQRNPRPKSRATRDVLPESPPGARQLVPPVSVEEGTESGQSAGVEEKKKKKIKKKSVYRRFFAGSQHRREQNTHSKGFSRKRLLIVRAETVVHQEASTLTRRLNQGCALRFITSQR